MASPAVPPALRYVAPCASFLGRVERSPPLTLSPVLPGVNVMSSKFAHCPACASELRLIVQAPPVTLTDVTSRIHSPFAVGGRSVRCSAEPQLRRAR